MREGTTLTVGIDLGDVRSDYFVVDADTGEVVDEGKVAMKRPAMRAWLASLPRARVAVLSNMFKEAIERGYAYENPVRSVKRAREELKEVPYLSAADIDRIISAADPRLRSLIAVAADTGLRRGELLALEWRDIQFRRGVLVVRRSKSKRPREVPLTSTAKSVLLELHAARTEPTEDQPDFVFSYIGSLKPSWAATFVASKFRKAAKTAGFPTVTFHGLRHAFCSRLAQSGVPLPTVKALAGHGSLALTSRYASHVPENAEAAAVKALESSDEAARRAPAPSGTPKERDDLQDDHHAPR